MNSSERRDRIRANLSIEPINHGQVYTFQIAIPESEQQNISLERHQLIKESLTQHKSNLVPVIVRRTEDYSDEEEYEVVYGADWCIVAKELDIEKLWVWVFEMTDEQATAAQEEMQQLAGLSIIEPDIGSLIEQKLRPIYTKLNQITSHPSGNAEKSDDEKLRGIESQLKELVSTVATLSTNADKSNSPPKINLVESKEEEISSTKSNDEKLRGIESQLKELVSTVATLSAKVNQLIPERLNLLEAKEEEISSAMEAEKATNNQIKAALEAIRYWKKSEYFTWEDIKKSTESKEHKIKNFGKGAYEKLKKVAYIASKQ